MIELHGLPLDKFVRFGPKRWSAYSSDVLEYGVSLFPDGRVLVTLPMGSGVANTLAGALQSAKERQATEIKGAS